MEKLTQNTWIPLSFALAMIAGAALLYSRLAILEERVPVDLKEQMVRMEAKIDSLSKNQYQSAVTRQ